MCVHNGRSNTSAAAELADLRKITFYGKTIFNEHPVPKVETGCARVSDPVIKFLWIRLRFEWLDPDPVCPGRLNPVSESANIRRNPKPWVAH